MRAFLSFLIFSVVFWNSCIVSRYSCRTASDSSRLQKEGEGKEGHPSPVGECFWKGYKIISPLFFLLQFLLQL